MKFVALFVMEELLKLLNCLHQFHIALALLGRIKILGQKVNFSASFSTYPCNYPIHSSQINQESSLLELFFESVALVGDA